MGRSGAVAHADDILTGLQNPGCFFFRIGSHIFQCKRKLHGFSLARSKKSGLFVSFQLLIGLLQSVFRCGNVYLNNFFSGILFSGIGHFCSYFYPGAFDGCLCLFNGKIGVAFAVAEAVLRLDAEGIKITVAHIDAIRIIFIVDVSVVVAEALGGGIIGVSLCPGIGQFSGGNLFAGENICHAQAAGVAQLTGEKNGVEACRLFDDCGIDDSADVQKNNGFLIMGAQKFQRFYFAVI